MFTRHFWANTRFAPTTNTRLMGNWYEILGVWGGNGARFEKGGACPPYVACAAWRLCGLASWREIKPGSVSDATDLLLGAENMAS